MCSPYCVWIGVSIADAIIGAIIFFAIIILTAYLFGGWCELKIPPQVPLKKRLKKPSRSQSQTHEPTTSRWPKTKEDFPTWFWDSKNGNPLILDINKFSNTNRWDDRIRREGKYSPFIYGIVLNDGDFPFKDRSVQWKLCKVGFTQMGSKRGENNRMEQVRDKIKKSYEPKYFKDAKAYIFFSLRFSAIDTNPYRETEKRIRKKVGKKVKKEKAYDLHLPYITEWVLTTQEHIDKIQTLIRKCRGEADLDIFESVTETPVPPEGKREEWLKLKVTTAGKTLAAAN